MELGQNLLFFFAALGAFNAFLLAGYLLFKRRQFTPSFLFLAFLLMCYAIRSGVSCLYFFDNIPRELIKTGLSAHLLAGPSLFYFVTVSLSNTKIKVGLIHLLILGVTLIILEISFDFYIWNYPLRYTIHGALFLYIVVAGIRLVQVFGKVVSSDGHLLKEEKHVLLVYVAFLLVCLGYVISLYTTYILGPVWFSLCFYGVLYLFFNSNHIANSNRYKKKLDEEEVGLVRKKMEGLLKSEQLYRDPDLTLEKLAQKLSVSKYFLSQMLNDNLNKSYSDLISEYRIDEACKLIGDNSHYTLEAIAYEVGFNSKSSFFSTFKRIKQVTPAKYRASIKSTV